jgi:hypothetical protein
MQRVSSLLPSWDRRISGSGSGSGSLPNNANANAHHANSTTKPATGGGLFGWSNRSSTTSTNTTNGLSKINIKAANRSSSAASIMSARIQREAFWPATLDVESEKAARIIKSFCGKPDLSRLAIRLTWGDCILFDPLSLTTPFSPMLATHFVRANAAGMAWTLLFLMLIIYS